MITLLILSATVITSLTALYALPELMQKGMLYPYQVVHEKKMVSTYNSWIFTCRFNTFSV